MFTRLIFVLTFIAFTLGCKAESKTTPTITANSPSIESAITNFSKALVEKDRPLLLTLADQKSIYLVRIFTSGTLGGRGEPLSEAMSSKKLDSELAFPIAKQTPFELPSLFMKLPIKSFKALPHRPLAAEIDNTHYDQWAPILKKSLAGAAEAVEADPILLSSTSGKYWVYAEAQIIDDMLVGSFAVFSPESDKLQLVAVIELL